MASLIAVRYVVLLRGINVGGNVKVAMADLRELLTELGYTRVRTHLQSGNAVLSSSQRSPETMAAAIEQAIAERLGLSVRCLILTPDQLRAVVTGNPLAEVATNPSRMFVHFLFGPVSQDRLGDVDPAEYQPERFALRGHELYVWLPDGMAKSRVLKLLTERRLGCPVTVRNWNTVTKLLELAEEEA